MSKKKNKMHAGNQDDPDGGGNEPKKKSKTQRMREANHNLDVAMKYFSLMTFVGISALLLFNEQTKMPFDEASRDINGKALRKFHQAVLAHSETDFAHMGINPLPTPIFWLRSKSSGKCFGPKGYADCGLRNIWTYEHFNKTISTFPHLSPAPQSQLCLSQSCHNCENPQVVVGDCGNLIAKNWKLKPEQFQVQKKLISYYDGYDAVELGMFCMSSGSRPRISDCKAAGAIETVFISIDTLLCEINPDRPDQVGMAEFCRCHKHVVLYMVITVVALGFMYFMVVIRDFKRLQHHASKIIYRSGIAKFVASKREKKRIAKATKIANLWRQRAAINYVRKEKERILRCSAGPFWPEEPLFKKKEKKATEEKKPEKKGFLQKLRVRVQEVKESVEDVVEVATKPENFNENDSDIESDDDTKTKQKEHVHGTAPKGIKSGAYEIKIHVIEVHDLQGVNLNGTSDPYVVAEVFGETKKTSYRRKTTTAVFAQWLDFFFQDLPAEDIGDGEIVIKVMDSNLFKDYLLGLIVVSTEDIYRQPNHMVWEHEFCLIDELFTTVKGYITCTIAVLGPGDNFTTYLKGDEVPECTLLRFPNTVRRERYWLKLSIFMVEIVPRREGKTDTGAFIRIDFGESTYTDLKGRRVYGDEPWVLNSQIVLPVAYPSPRKHLFLSVWDKTPDILRGFYALEIKDIKKRSDIGKPRWLNLYHNSSQEVYGTRFRSGQFLRLDDCETEYSGRILLSAHFEKQTDKEAKTNAGLEPKVYKKTFQTTMKKYLSNPKYTVQAPDSEQYILRFLVTYGCELPVPNENDCRVRIAIGPKTKHTQARKSMKGNSQWDEILMIEDLEVPAVVINVPDIFIYLEKEKGGKFEIVSFKRYTALELLKISNGTIGFELMHLQWANQNAKHPEPPKAPGSIMMQLSLNPIPKPGQEDIEVPLELPESFDDIFKSKNKALSAPVGDTVESKKDKDKVMDDAAKKAKDKVKDNATNSEEKRISPMRIRNSFVDLRKLLKPKNKTANGREERSSPGVISRKSFGDMVHKLDVTQKINLGLKNSIKYELRVHCYQARDLWVTDSSGTADPFVEVHFMGQDKRSETRIKTRDPKFFQTLKMDVELPPALLKKKEDVDTLAPPVSIRVWDEDRYGQEFMGKCFVNMSEAYELSQNIDINDAKSEPKWYTLYNGEKECGKIMVSLQLIEKTRIRKTEVDELNIKPEMTKAHIEITVVGLRSLVSKGFGNIENPYIKFHLDGMEDEFLFKTRKSKLPTPENPNFCQVLSTETHGNGPVAIPRNPLYAPSLRLEIKDDHVGRANTRIGITRISLEEKIPWSAKHQEIEEEEVRFREKTGSFSNPSTIEKSTSLSNASQSGLKEGTADGSTFSIASFKRDFIALPSKKIKKYLNSNTMELEEDDNQEDGGKFNLLQATQQNEENQNVKEDKGESQEVKEAPTDQEISGAEETKEESQEVKEEPTDQDISGAEETKEESQESTNPFDGAIQNAKNKISSGVKSLVKDFKDVKDEKECYKEEKDIEEGPFGHIKDEMKDRAILHGSIKQLLLTLPFDDKVIHRRDEGTKLLEPVGLFKGFIRIYEDKTEKDSAETMKSHIKELEAGADYEVRVYILRATNLRPTGGFFSEQLLDPYIRIQLDSINQQPIVDRDNSIDNTNDPDFFKVYKLRAHLPGPSQLKISVWDKGVPLPINDTLIGETTVDLENRWFDERWQNLGLNAEKKDKNRLRPKPVEMHKLKLQHQMTNQGFLFFWIDILTLADSKIYKPVKIDLPPICDIQIRVIIWATRSVKGVDVTSDILTAGLNDLYVKAWVQGHDDSKQSTDTHWRARQMDGSYNWRMIFDVELGPTPAKDAELLKFPKLYYQVFDQDIIKYDDNIGAGEMQMPNLLKCYREHTPQQLFSYEKTKAEAAKEKDDRKKMVANIKKENKNNNRIIGLISIVLILTVAYLCFDTYRVMESQSSMKWTKDMYFKMIQRIDETDEIYSKIFYIQDPDDGKCLGRKGFRRCGFNSVWGVSNQSYMAFLNPALTFKIVGYPPNGPADKKPNDMECLAPSHCKYKPAAVKARDCDTCGADTWTFDKQKVIVNEMCIRRLPANPVPTTVNCTRTIKGEPAYTELKIIETSSNALQAEAGIRLDLLQCKKSLPRTVWRTFNRQRTVIFYMIVSVSLLVMVQIQLSIYHKAKLDEQETDISKLTSDRANARELTYAAKSFLGKLKKEELKADWVPIKRTLEGSNPEIIGELLISCEAVPKKVAATLQVGMGRDAPNQAPYLPPPSGRLKLTLNPFAMLAELLGAKLMFRVLAILFFVVFIPLGYFVYLYLKPYIKLGMTLLELFFF